MIFYHDGLGHGFGNMVLNHNISAEMREKIGVSKDIRDYNAAALLLKEQLQADNKNTINLLYSCNYN